MPFDHNAWIAKFLRNPGYNDATDKGVVINRTPGANARCIGVHVLTPEENTFDSHVVLAVVGPDSNRVPDARIDWEWEGMWPSETATPVILDKPDPEPPGNLWMAWGMTVTVRVWNVLSDSVSGLHTRHKREEEGQNREGHWSYLAVFQIGGDTVPEPEPPEPGEPPVSGYPPEIIAAVKEVGAGIAKVLEMMEAA